MTSARSIRPAHVAALCLGIGLGLTIGQWRAAGEHAAHDHDDRRARACAEVRR